MKKYLFLIILLLIPGFVLAEDLSDSIYNSANTISLDTEESVKAYISDVGGKNALLVTGGNSVLNKCSVDKKGNYTADTALFYGTNAGIIVNNGSLKMLGGRVNTDGTSASGIFAYGSGKIDLNEVTINTSADNSSGLIVSGGGTLNAENCTGKTYGNSSPAIKSNKNGGTILITGGGYETNGKGSPVVYSGSDISINEAKLISTASEGIILDGNNSVSLNKVTLDTTNNSLYGDAKTYKSILIYQSDKNDTSTGKASLSISNSSINTHNGDAIYVTNIDAEIIIDNSDFYTKEGTILRIGKSSYGDNGGNVTLNLNKQNIKGNIVVDEVSTLSMAIKNESFFDGGINSEKTSKKVAITMSKDSVWLLESDSYITSLINVDQSNGNIYSNGYKLYLNNKEVKINDGSYTMKESTEKNPEASNESTKKEEENGGFGGIIVFFVVCAVVAVAAFVIMNIYKKNNSF